MKKLIFGCTLLICGVIGFCAEYIYQAIMFAGADTHTLGTSYQYGIIIMVAGLAICVAGFMDKSDKNK